VLGGVVDGGLVGGLSGSPITLITKNPAHPEKRIPNVKIITVIKKILLRIIDFFI
jgi:hypothetical protein